MLAFILAALWFTLILHIDLISDVKKWKKGIPVEHFKESVKRAVFLLPSVIALTVPIETSVWGDLILSIVIHGFTWLLLFDGLYNLRRGYNWWFLGSVDEDESWWDNLQRKIPLKVLKIIKIAIPIILITIYFINENSVHKPTPFDRG